MKFERIKHDLKLDEGIWKSTSNSTISYPSDGNANFFQIEENSFWFKHRNNCLVAAIKNHEPNGVILDVGGGNGFVSKGLQNAGLDVSLLEPGFDGIMNAKQRGVKNLIWSTFEDANFDENSLPAVGIFDVLEHIEDDHSFLNTLHKSLKPEGKLYMTVPAYEFLWSREDIDAGHFRRYTIHSASSDLKKAGFKVKYTTYFFLPLPAPIYIMRSLPTRLGFRKKASTLESHQSDHTSKPGVADKVVNSIFNWELNRIKRNKSIPIGSSCLIVAEKSM